MPRTEYRVVQFRSKWIGEKVGDLKVSRFTQAEGFLDELAAEGWEVVTMIVAEGWFVFTLKRTREEVS